MLNKVFTDLTVINVAPSYKSGKKSYRAMWLCKCVCGNVSKYSGTRLKTGKSKRCKICAYRLRPQSIQRFTYFERLYKIRIVTNAKNRGILVNLTLDEFRYLVQQDCFYCKTPGIIIDYVGQTKHTWSEKHAVNGIDRIDSTKEYTFNNCVPCCKTCNFMKSNMSTEQFKNHIILLYKNYVDKKD